MACFMQLYVHRVFIMDNCEDLILEYIKHYLLHYLLPYLKAQALYGYVMYKIFRIKNT